jgi:hypothetical protein
LLMSPFAQAGGLCYGMRNTEKVLIECIADDINRNP